MKLSFLGAAQQVTGSMHLLELKSGYKVLIDCGLDYDKQDGIGFREKNLHFPFEPASVDVVILTHAHIDHSGNLPNLVRQGFNGNIICTPATADLCQLLLMDSVNVQRGELRKARGKRKKKVSHNILPLYTEKHVAEAMEQFLTVSFNRTFDLDNELTLTFREAGHILGAASVELEINEDGKTKRIGFTGDLGRNGSKLVKDPVVMQNLNYLVSESTYGGRTHRILSPAEEDLMHHIEETCIKVNGRLIIPAFSVGRTQSILFTLHQLYQKGLLPRIKIFVDSPLAIKSTYVYHKYKNILNEEATAFYDEHGELFEFDLLHLIDDARESEELRYYHQACIIVSAAGMVEGGRIQQHVSDNIQNPYSTILVAGYCAPGTLGYRLLQGQPSILIRGKEKQVYAKVTSTDVFSAHPDHQGLKDYINNSFNPSFKTLFLVHGDEQAMDKLKADMETSEKIDVETPLKGDIYTI